MKTVISYAVFAIFVATGWCYGNIVPVYHSLFQSYLLYGSLAWSFTNQGNIDRLTKMQKRCIRILTFAPFDAHINPLFSKLGIIKVEDVIVIQKLLFMLDVQKRTVLIKNLTVPFQFNSALRLHVSEMKCHQNSPRDK